MQSSSMSRREKEGRKEKKVTCTCSSMAHYTQSNGRIKLHMRHLYDLCNNTKSLSRDAL